MWATRESESLTLFPSILPSPLSTANLRRKLTQDAVIESQWQKDALALEELIKIYPRFESHLYAAEVLPGGEHILFVYFDGVLDLVRADSTVHLDNPGPISSDLGDVNQIHLELHRYRVSQSSEFGGYIVVELDLKLVTVQVDIETFADASSPAVFEYIHSVQSPGIHTSNYSQTFPAARTAPLGAGQDTPVPLVASMRMTCSTVIPIFTCHCIT